MRTIKKTKQLRNILSKSKRPIAFVPTMGYLHEGHLSLMDRAARDAGTVVVSIFVNPTQFGPNEDYQKYPRDIKRDSKLLKERKVDLLFLPQADQIYSDDIETETRIEADKSLSASLCGLSRPGHFDGVVTVVNKLFNIIQPDIAVFGKKDYQQLLIIKKMVDDLKMYVKIIGSDIVREEDGLAMSSRNKYLSKGERERALILSQSLKTGARLLKNGESLTEVKKLLYNSLRSRPQDRLDYLEILDRRDLSETESYSRGNTLIAIAMYIGSTRLIDNIVC